MNAKKLSGRQTNPDYIMSSYPCSASPDGTLGGADPDIHLTRPVDACSDILAVLGVLVSILCLNIFYIFDKV